MHNAQAKPRFPKLVTLSLAQACQFVLLLYFTDSGAKRRHGIAHDDEFAVFVHTGK